MHLKFLFSLVLFPSILLAQEVDLLSIVDSAENAGAKKQNEKVFATFKTTKIIGAQSTETVKGKHLDFRITHRFGNIGAQSNGGGHTLWGFDESQDIRFSFDYGITDQLQIGVARSKMFELLDGSIKYRFLEQTTNNKVPVSIVVYSCIGITPMNEDGFYNGTVDVTRKFSHRISYTTQLVIARKFSKSFSFEIIPGYTHRNFVKRYVNTSNNAEEENGIPSIGAGARIKLTKRLCVNADYFFIKSDFRKNNSETPYYMPLAVGFEIETGGHVFHLNLTNASGINENNFIPYTTDSWLKGGYKFGFNISRIFNF